MERPPLAGANAKPNAPRVRTVGFSVYGEQREEEPEAGGAEDTSPLPVMIPPAFQAEALSHDTAGDASPARKPRAAPVARSATPPPSPAPAPAAPTPPATPAAAEPAEAPSPAAEPQGRRGPPPEPKPKLSKAERRELQESQRAAKAVRQGGDAPAKPPPKPAAPRPAEPAPAAAAAGGAAARGAPAGGAPRRGVPVPEAVQFDDKRVVARLQRKSLVPRKESGRAIELFAHLPQFDHQSLQDALASSSLIAGGAGALHPAVMQLGCHYADGTVSGGRARCLALLRVLHKVISDYVTPPERTLARDLTAKINVIVQFLIDCRPLGVSMGNAIKSVKTALADAGQRSGSEAEAKAALLEHIDHYIQERLLLADTVIQGYVTQKIRDGDVILTHAHSATVLGALVAAAAAGRKFRVVVVDSRPRLEGRATLAALLRAGVSCTYSHAAAVSYLMRGVSLVLLGAAAVLSNGAVVSRVGTGAVAMVARAHGVPVLVCAQTCKLHERTQLDSITNNELGDPDALASVDRRPDVAFLKEWDAVPRLRLLNLAYDVTPAECVTMIVTEVGMLPPSSVPVVLREYRKEVPL